MGVGLASFVVAVYAVVVVGGGLLMGRTDSPSLLLSILATAAVALLFAPVQRLFERATTPLRRGLAAEPYDVLRQFSAAMKNIYPTEDLPARMSMLLAQGTGARWVQVWLIVSGRPVLAATWPPHVQADATPPDPGTDGDYAARNGRREAIVRHGEQVLGSLRLQERPDVTLTSVEERLFAGLAAQAGLVLRLAGQRGQLEERFEELAARADELKASRERLIEAQDRERRRLERDLHDGAQQHLVALAVNLRLAQTIRSRSPERAARVLSEQADAVATAIETLASLSRGIYPRLLAAEGLAPALRFAVANSAVRVTVSSDLRGRIPTSAEAALYFCGMEAVQNAAKHSRADLVSVLLLEKRDRWELIVTDHGRGFDPRLLSGTARGAGLVNMSDRLDAVGGAVVIDSAPGRGTTVTAVVPRAGARESPPRALVAASGEGH